MNGAHDLGGMDGFGPVDPDPAQPVFKAAWERRVFAMTLATGFLGQWNIDKSRHARERMDPAEYLATSYYEHWLHGLETLLSETGILETAPAKPALKADRVEATLHKGATARRPDEAAPKFTPGQRVTVRNLNPMGHTRAPRYIRGRSGTIDRDHGVFVFPDTNAAGAGAKPQHVYSVRFEARDVWGPEDSLGATVYMDLWDDYLEPA